MSFKDYKKDRPKVGTRILAFSPVYKRGDPMRFRMVTEMPVPLEEVTAYVTAEDLEDAVMVDALFGSH